MFWKISWFQVLYISAPGNCFVIKCNKWRQHIITGADLGQEQHRMKRVMRQSSVPEPKRAISSCAFSDRSSAVVAETQPSHVSGWSEWLVELRRVCTLGWPLQNQKSFSFIHKTETFAFHPDSLGFILILVLYKKIKPLKSILYQPEKKMWQDPGKTVHAIKNVASIFSLDQQIGQNKIFSLWCFINLQWWTFIALPTCPGCAPAFA